VRTARAVMTALAAPERFDPEDFVVEEIPAYAPSGAGGHTFVRIEKRGRTTEAVARELARVAGVRPGDVGFGDSGSAIPVDG